VPLPTVLPVAVDLRRCDPREGQWFQSMGGNYLFVDQDGIPTLVEVRRQSDTRLRREVVRIELI